MFLDEIFRPKTGDEVLMSAEDMRQARISVLGMSTSLTGESPERRE